MSKYTPTVRLSVTDLDQYLYWLGLEDEGPEWLINRLTVFEPSPAMEAGSAFHAALEQLTNSVSLLVHEGYQFSIPCEAEFRVPGLRELKIEQEILPGVILVGKIDAIDGNRITDYKLTAKLDVDRYCESMQWRAYLMLFGTSEFEYSIFEGSPDRNQTVKYTIREHHILKFYSYPEMNFEVKQCAGELAKFVLEYNVTAKMVYAPVKFEQSMANLLTL